MQFRRQHFLGAPTALIQIPLPQTLLAQTPQATTSSHETFPHRLPREMWLLFRTALRACSAHFSVLLHYVSELALLHRDHSPPILPGAHRARLLPGESFRRRPSKRFRGLLHSPATVAAAGPE